MLVARGAKVGIEVVKVSPAYSSLIGLTKYMKMYGLSSDTAAGLVLARRYLRLSERIPAKYALLVKVNASKHVWSVWNQLSKKLRCVSRHSFFGVANSQLEVNLVGSSSEQSGGRFTRKSSDASRSGRDSQTQVDNTVRSATDEPIQLSIFDIV